MFTLISNDSPVLLDFPKKAQDIIKFCLREMLKDSKSREHLRPDVPASTISNFNGNVNTF